MAKLTVVQSPKLRQKTLWDSITTISLPELAAGPLLCESPDGTTGDKSGRGPVHVSPGLRPAGATESMTKDTCGQNSSDSSEVTGPQSCSGSKSPAQKLSAKLTAEMAAKLMSRQFGSMEYSLTWIQHSTPARHLIYRLRASIRRTSGKDFGGWPSPAVQNSEGGANPDGNTGEHFTLQTAAGLAGYPTPQASDTASARPPRLKAEKRDAKTSGARDPNCIGNYRMDLKDLPQLLNGWPTPDSSHHGNIGPEKALKRINSHLNGGPKYSTNLDDVAALTGWNTPTAEDSERGANSQFDSLQRAAQFTGWPTPRAEERCQQNSQDGYMALSKAVPEMLTGWATPLSKDSKSEAGIDRSVHSRGTPLNYQVLGATSESSPAEMERVGASALNPAMSRWLMGYPQGPLIHGWDSSSPHWESWVLVQKILSGYFARPETTE